MTRQAYSAVGHLRHNWPRSQLPVQGHERLRAVTHLPAGDRAADARERPGALSDRPVEALDALVQRDVPEDDPALERQGHLDEHVVGLAVERPSDGIEPDDLAG